MAWTETTRRRYDRSGLRYASDCTDEEWNVISLFVVRTGSVGRPTVHDVRVIWDAIQYQATSGCQWRRLPKDFPPFTTVQHSFYRWRDEGLFVAINEALVAANRLVEGRNEAPTAAIIDSQSVKTTESGGPRGYDADKKIKGRKLSRDNQDEKRAPGRRALAIFTPHLFWSWWVLHRSGSRFFEAQDRCPAVTSPTIRRGFT